MSKPSNGECDIRKPCPRCGERQLTLSWWLEAKPIGTFSLAGQQLKFSARENAVVRCQFCRLVLQGRITPDAEVVNGRFVSGHFETTQPQTRSENKPRD